MRHEQPTSGPTIIAILLSKSRGNKLIQITTIVIFQSVEELRGI